MTTTTTISITHSYSLFGFFFVVVGGGGGGGEEGE